MCYKHTHHVKNEALPDNFSLNNTETKSENKETNIRREKIKDPSNINKMNDEYTRI